MQNLESDIFAGLNSDDEDRVVPKGDYRYALNIHTGSSEGGKNGAIVNMKGNTVVSISLPSGTNKVVGSTKDEATQQIIYLVYNSNNDDQIYSFDEKTQTIQLLAQADFGFTEDKIIHGIDLVDGDKLYWTDSKTEPKKINIKKAPSNKPREINLYFDTNSVEIWKTTDVSYTLNVNTSTYVISNMNAGPSHLGSSTRDEVAERFEHYINQIATANSYPFYAKACGPYITIVFTDNNENTVRFISNYTSTITTEVAQNYYPNYNYDVYNQIKASPACNPTFSYGTDQNRGVNLLSEKTFQFAVRYNFDDYEITTLSPYSCLAFEAGCDIVGSGSNYIDVDFSDDRLNDATSLSVIKKVDILVREGNAGAWKIAETLDQWDFGISNNTYRFYNDGIYPVLSEVEANKLYDTVPKKSETQEFMKNRLFHGNYTQGFNPVCVDASVDVSYENPPADQETYDIEGYIFISSALRFANGNLLGYYGQPVTVEEDPALAQWGGYDYGGPTSNANGLISDYNQKLPLEGFTVYLAGTDYQTQTIQKVFDGGVWKDVNDPTLPTALPINNAVTGVLDGTSAGNRNDIRTYLGTSNGGYAQKFTINNVPNGKYILRVASHRTESSDLSAGDRKYQKTSTNVMAINNTADIFGADFGEFEVPITVAGSNTDAGFVYVADLTYPGVSAVEGKALSGYMAESIGASGVDILDGPRMEKCKVNFQNGNGAITNTYFTSGTRGGSATTSRAYTDHNGYWFGTIAANSAIGANFRIDPVGDTGNSLNVALGFNFRDFDGNNFSGNTSSGGFPTTSTSENQDVLLECTSNTTFSTAFIQSTLTDTTTGTGISGVPIVITGSGIITETDATGKYKIKVYGDTKYYDDSGVFTKTRFFEPYPLSLFGSCFLQINLFTGTTYNFPIGPGSPPSEYNLTTSPYIFSFDYLSPQIVSGQSMAFKRGWDGRFGIIYRDEGSRISFVNSSEELQTHINFYTETDKDNNQENYGVPKLTWQINHEPPSWATHYQWVRTKNEQLDDYLQWAVNDVKYVECSDLTSDVGYSNGEIAAINIENIADYESCGAKSFIGVNIDDSYRIRFIKDENSNFYTSYLDFPIISATATEIFVDKSNDIEIKPGVTFEVYRPKREASNRLYYEFGECHEINEQKLAMKDRHVGEIQSQRYWSFDDNADAGTYCTIMGLPAPANPGNVAFTTQNASPYPPTFSGVSHPYSVGDVVKIIQDYGFVHNSYESFHTIIEVIDNKTVVIDKPFAGSTPLNPGEMNAPAIGEFECGDAYYRNRSLLLCTNESPTAACTLSNIIINVDDDSVSDFYLSEDQGIGRINVENPLSRETLSNNQVTYSGTIIEDSFINSLNSFSGVDIEDLPEEYGDLMKLQRAQNVLLAIGQYKTASLYINEQIITNTDGTGNLASSNKVIGTVRAFQETFGTMNPESVAEYVGSVYWWDVNNASVVRYSKAGLQALSDQKFADWFTQKSKEILSTNLDKLPNVIGTYDPYFVEYIISFDGYSDLIQPETLAFSEWINRWTSFYSYLPEKMENVGMTVVAFKDGELWVQDSNPLRNNFFGVQYNSQVQPIANDNPKNIKVFRAVSVESNKAWSCPSLTIPANAKYLQGMETRIKEGRFVNKEGIFYSEIPKDLNSPGYTGVQALINGRDMRGKILNILFQNDDTDEVVFFSFNVKSSLSELSNR